MTCCTLANEQQYHVQVHDNLSCISAEFQLTCIRLGYTSHKCQCCAIKSHRKRILILSYIITVSRSHYVLTVWRVDKVFKEKSYEPSTVAANSYRFSEPNRLTKPMQRHFR